MRLKISKKKETNKLVVLRETDERGKGRAKVEGGFQVFQVKECALGIYGM